MFLKSEIFGCILKIFECIFKFLECGIYYTRYFSTKKGIIGRYAE